MGDVIDIRFCKDIFVQILEAIQELDGNTDEIEAKLNTIITELNTLNTNDFATEATLIQVRDYVDQLESLLNSLDNKDFATETTLTGIKSKTDQLTFTGGDLNVNASFSGESPFGANATVTTIPGAIVSTLLKASNTNRKELYIVNSSNKTMWVKYVSPAVFGTGIMLMKDEILIEDRFTGNVYGIWDTGVTGNAEVTEVTL